MSATETDLVAADWLQRKTFWNWGEEDQAALDAWLAESEAHRVAYWRQSAMWNRTERLAALRPSSKPQRSTQTERKSFGPFLMRSAAVVGAVAILGVLATNYAFKSREIPYSTTIGGSETITLADGTLIQLNTDTALRTRFDEHHREVVLDRGEAFFQVTHDAKRPFVVMAAGHRVTDLGTKFSVRNGDNRVEVSLIEGRAQFESTTSNKAQSAVLKPGDVVVATEHSMHLTRASQENLSKQLGWRRGVLIFDNTTLATAAKEFNRYNRRKLVIGDNAAANLTIVGTFQANDVEAFADVAQFILHLKVQKRDQETVVSRR
ncbi:MAG TPA: FecR domain-containing protein [Rhizomicrobium sp.]|jgi:transmembrane sensor